MPCQSFTLFSHLYLEERDSKESYFLDLCTSPSICYIQVHLSRNNVPVVKPPLNYTSLPSTVATFLTTRFMAVLQPSGYSVFYGGDTPIQLSLPWRSYSYQCLNTETFAWDNRGFTTETSAWDNRGFTTETLSISYNISLYIRLVVIL